MKRKYDVMIILAGGVNEDGELTEITKQRVRTGVKYWKRSSVGKMVMSGAWSFVLQFTPPIAEAVAMKRFAQKLGVDGRNILCEEVSDDTVGNAFFTKVKFVEPNKWRSLIVVTSDYHMARTKYIFKKIFGEDYKIKFVSTPSKLTQIEYLEKLAFERQASHLIKGWFRKVRNGNDKLLFKAIAEKDPGYSKYRALRAQHYEKYAKIYKFLM